jgi:hypothetical protein
MARLRLIKLSDAEIGHLLTLIEWNEQSSYYYGNKQLFVERSDRIKDKLKLIDTGEEIIFCDKNGKEITKAKHEADLC